MTDNDHADVPTAIASWLRPVPEHQRELALALAEMAQETSGRLAAAQMSNLPLSEESITEPMLINLKQTVPGLEIRALTKAAESREGADWEFWIEGDHQWFAFLVQAKKSKRSNKAQGATYDLGYLSGKETTPQVYLLARTSAARGMPGVYAFYNDPMLFVDYLRSSCRKSGIPAGLEGISTMSVGTARWLFQGGWDKPVPVDIAAPFTFPWSCLAACPVTDECLATVLPVTETDPESMGFAAGTSEDDPALATARAVHQVEKAHWGGTFATQTQAKATGWGVWDTVPDYVPRPGTESETLSAYPEDGFPAPAYVVALWRRRD